MDRTPVQMTAAVPNLETVEMPVPIPVAPVMQLVTEAPPKRAERPSGPGFQANLFGLKAVEPAQPPAATATAPNPPKRPRNRRDGSMQQSLNFPEDRRKSPVEASISSDNPVALAAHRMMAAAIDMGLAFLALGVFLATFQLAGADFVFTKATSPYYVVAAILICLFYRVLFCIANFDTPGVCWTGMKVVDFDGRAPSRKHRWYRLLGGFVGAIAAGIGLLWAVVDEDRLTWHDHISKTFPTPRFL